MTEVTSLYVEAPSSHEIERRWLVAGIDSIPFDLSSLETIEMEQRYPVNPRERGHKGKVTRLRRENDKLILTSKLKVIDPNSKAKISQENNTQVTNNSQRHADILWEAGAPALTQKTRYNLPLDEKHLAQIDVFKKPTGLIIVEVEFNSVKSSNEFSPPSWFGREVTKDDGYSNSDLAFVGMPQQ